jgi:ubiquinone/menaquinone biosynthesis C-methylase UbiE
MWYEHWHRYHYVAPALAGKEVLDVACGEGYGAALIAKHAKRVCGADLSAQAIAHAKAAYSSIANAEFVAAPCTRLPFPDASFDVVVSFETVEHIEEQDAFLGEIKRVLRHDGVLILSSPNKPEYSGARGYDNEFHVRELDGKELEDLLARYFPHTLWLGQRNGFFSLIWPRAEAKPAGEALSVSSFAPSQTTPFSLAPLYFIVVAGANAHAVASAKSSLSVFSDEEEFAYRDYRKIFRDLTSLAALHEDLQQEKHELEAVLAARNADLTRAQSERDDAANQLRALNTGAEQMRQALTACQHQLKTRAGLRGWLLAPLRMAKRLFFGQ